MSVAPLSNTIWRGLPGLFVRRNGTFSVSVQRQRLAFGVWRRSELRFQHGLLQISELRDLCVFVVISTLCALYFPPCPPLRGLPGGAALDSAAQ
jgi:hypothetical protein